MPIYTQNKKNVSVRNVNKMMQWMKWHKQTNDQTNDASEWMNDKSSYNF